jgi:hypothetical protein
MQNAKARFAWGTDIHANANDYKFDGPPAGTSCPLGSVRCCTCPSCNVPEPEGADLSARQPACTAAAIYLAYNQFCGLHPFKGCRFESL